MADASNFFQRSRKSFGGSLLSAEEQHRGRSEKGARVSGDKCYQLNNAVLDETQGRQISQTEEAETKP